MADPYALELGIAFGMLPLAMICGYIFGSFSWTCFKRTQILIQHIRSFDIYDIGIYQINGVKVGVDEPFVPTKLCETHTRWKTHLIDFYHRAAANWVDAQALDIEFMAIEHQMRKEVVYFDRVCCLDVPDLVKAKVWGFL